MRNLNRNDHVCGWQCRACAQAGRSARGGGRLLRLSVLAACCCLAPACRRGTPATAAPAQTPTAAQTNIVPSQTADDSNATGTVAIERTAEGVYVINDPAALAGFCATSGPTVVLFYSRTSVPCVMMSALTSRLAAVYSNQVAFVRVDLSAADAAPIEAQYIVKAVPTFVFLMNGRETHRLVGSTARDRLTFMIERKLLHP